MSSTSDMKFSDFVASILYGTKGSSEKGIIKYFQGDLLAAKVYMDKYENPTDTNNPKSTPQDMINRIIERILDVEDEYDNPLTAKRLHELFDNFKYIIPGGSVLYGLNNPGAMVSLSNCFVIGDDWEKDSYGSIMKRDEEQIQLMKRRGGVGQDLSFIRSRGSLVRNAAKTSTGVVPFAERYSNSIKEVAQEGRRGAGMLTLDFTHDDALHFINAKANTDKITGANISIKMDDDQVLEMSQLIDKYPGDRVISDRVGHAAAGRRGLLDRPVAIPDSYYDKGSSNNNNEKFNAIIKNARNFSEPGILFWDRVRDQIDSSLYSPEFSPISTNPCGELPLAGDEACRLLSLVLYSYVTNPFTPKADFDFVRFEKDVEDAQKIMDDIVTLEIEQLDHIIESLEIEEDENNVVSSRTNTMSTEIELWKRIRTKAYRGRRTGLGFTALGDAIAALGHTFGSKASIDFAEEVAKTLMRGSYRSSIILARDRGKFPAYRSHEVSSDNLNISKIKALFYDEPEILGLWEAYGRRNIQNLAIAPTGTISILAQTSSGIEPVFNLRYTRRRRALANTKDIVLIKDENGELWEEFNVVHHKFVKWAKITGNDTDLNLSKISDKKFNEIVKKSPYYKATAHEINPEDKITMQGMVQKWIDSSISNTLNLPENVTEKEVLQYALYAWEIGNKGFTVYREGSRSGILINKKKQIKPFSQIDATERPKILDCEVHTTVVSGSKWVVLIGKLDNKPYEVFAFQGKIPIDDEFLSFGLQRVKRGHYRLITKGAMNVSVIDNINEHFRKPEEEFITRLISTSLRHGTHVKHIYDQLLKSKGYITDFQKAIARILKHYIKDEEFDNNKEICPECGSVLVYENGCVGCNSCGYSKC